MFTVIRCYLLLWFVFTVIRYTARRRQIPKRNGKKETKRTKPQHGINHNVQTHFNFIRYSAAMIPIYGCIDPNETLRNLTWSICWWCWCCCCSVFFHTIRFVSLFCFIFLPRGSAIWFRSSFVECLSLVLF